MVGISLGSKTCYVSYIPGSESRVEVIANEDGERATPTCISFQTESLVV